MEHQCHRTTAKRVQHSGYWGLWSVLAEEPSHILPAPHAPPACYDFAILGHRASQDTTPLEQQHFAGALKDAVIPHAGGANLQPLSVVSIAALTPPPATSSDQDVVRAFAHECRALLQVRVLLVSVNNGIVFKTWTRWAARTTLTRECDWLQSTVIFENWMFEQIQRVAESDRTIGVHGNGCPGRQAPMC